MKVNKKFTLTIGIPAYNEETNITNLLKQILKQKQDNFLLKEIIVISDGSSDNTVDEIKKIREKSIILIDGKNRLGKLRRIKQVIEKATGDIIALLDADIKLESPIALYYLMEPFYKNSEIGLVGGNRKPYKAKTFIEKSVQTSIRAYDNIALHKKDGNNPFNCHGCILALSNKFAKGLSLPNEIFSEDTYLYFSCITKGYKFYFAQKALVKIKTADNLKDVILQYKRFLAIDQLSKKLFGNLIEQEYKVTQKLRYKYILKEFIKNPIHSAFMFLIKTYCKYSYNDEKRAVWTIAPSTKGNK